MSEGDAIQLYFNSALENQVLKAWNVLDRRQIRTQLIEIESRPHITLFCTAFIEPTKLENGGSAKVDAAFDGDTNPQAVDVYRPMEIDPNPESDAWKKLKSSSILPWRSARVSCAAGGATLKYHPVKVIKRRKCGGPNDYEYYVHYSECKIQFHRLKAQFCRI